MPAFLIQIISWVLSIITSVALVFTPVTQAVVNNTYETAVSFEQVQYEKETVTLQWAK